MVSKEEVLAITRQCELLDVPRSTYYYGATACERGGSGVDEADGKGFIYLVAEVD